MSLRSVWVPRNREKVHIAITRDVRNQRSVVLTVSPFLFCVCAGVCAITFMYGLENTVSGVGALLPPCF